MRYKVFVTDFDGTIANHGYVSKEMLEALGKLKATGRKLILVTGREMKDLARVFSEYKIFDFVIAENGAVIHYCDTGVEELLGPSPNAEFVKSLHEKGVMPLSVGKVIVATWEPHDKTVLDAIKESGFEYQVIFNKGAVMILPPGLNKATGLLSLLQTQHISPHNAVAVGDAENDSALLQVTEYSAAVDNALPSLKELADVTLPLANGSGVIQLIETIIGNDLSDGEENLFRHKLHLGSLDDLQPFEISPYRSGILFSGVSGSGKSTLTAALTESLKKQGYQYCLVDPEGDYLELPDVIVIGNETSTPSLEEIGTVLKNPAANVVICTLSIPLADRPAFFFKLLDLLQDLRKEYAHPHWILIDEAHHVMPVDNEQHSIPTDFKNFVVITTTPDALLPGIIQKVGMTIMVGENPETPMKQFASVRKLTYPRTPKLEKGEALVWDLETNKEPFAIDFNLPVQLQQRHKRKYARGDLQDKSFLFTGKEKKLGLKASNLMMFAHIAEGIDNETWEYHLKRNDFTNWFRESIGDEELANASDLARHKSAGESKKIVIDFIRAKYTA